MIKYTNRGSTYTSILVFCVFCIVAIATGIITPLCFQPNKEKTEVHTQTIVVLNSLRVLKTRISFGIDYPEYNKELSDITVSIEELRRIINSYSSNPEYWHIEDSYRDYCWAQENWRIELTFPNIPEDNGFETSIHHYWDSASKKLDMLDSVR